MTFPNQKSTVNHFSWILFYLIDLFIYFYQVCISPSCCVQVSLWTSNRSPSPDMMTKASHCDRSASLASSRAWLCRSERHTAWRSIETLPQPLQTFTADKSQIFHTQPHRWLNAVSGVFFSMSMLLSHTLLKWWRHIDNPEEMGSPLSKPSATVGGNGDGRPSQEVSNPTAKWTRTTWFPRSFPSN